MKAFIVMILLMCLRCVDSESPPSRPVMTVNNGEPIEHMSVVTVTNDDVIEVTCRADGVYPQVCEVTLTCGGTIDARRGNESSLTIHVKKENNSMKCTCRADQLNKCYDSASEFTMNVLYAPNVTSFKANSQPSELTVSVDDSVTFVCDVEGNPRPDVSVKGHWSNGVVGLQYTPKGLYRKENLGTKKMSCKDTDTYVCMADNGVGDGMNKTVSVFVRCGPSIQQKVPLFAPSLDKSLQIRIPIFGYPVPKKYNLRKLYAGTHDVKEYNVMYVPGHPGDVVLTMKGLVREDNGQYVLIIDNGIGQGLNYTFNITDEQEKKTAADDYDSSDVVTPVGLCIGLLLGVVLCAACFTVWGKVGRRRRTLTNDKDKEITEDSMQGQHQQSPQQEPIPDDYTPLNFKDIKDLTMHPEEDAHLYLGVVPKSCENIQTQNTPTLTVRQGSSVNVTESNEDDDSYEEPDPVAIPSEQTLAPTSINENAYSYPVFPGGRQQSTQLILDSEYGNMNTIC